MKKIITQCGTVLIDVLVTVTVIVVVAAVVYKITYDDDAPSVTGAVVTSSLQNCKSSTIQISFTATEPLFWYQDDTGIASITINTSSMNYPPEFYNVSMPYSYKKTGCNNIDVFNTGAADHNGNTSAGSATINNLPQAYCCNEVVAAQQGCNCQ